MQLSPRIPQDHTTSCIFFLTCNYATCYSLFVRKQFPGIFDKFAVAGFDHRPDVVTTGGQAALEQLDHVHLVTSLLKRWLGGTHQGAVTPSHLQAYLDEFSSRFNRRLSRHRGKLFYRLMQQAVTMRPPTVKALYASKPQHVRAT